MSRGSAHRIVRDVLQFPKLSARWVPHQLPAELKEQCVDACQELFKHFEAESHGFLGRIIIGHETWVHYTSWKPRKRARNGAIPPHQN
jgi:hypothetical protein